MSITIEHTTEEQLAELKESFYYNEAIGFMTLGLVDEDGHTTTLTFTQHPLLNHPPILNSSIELNRNSTTKSITLKELLIFTDVARAFATDAPLTNQLLDTAEEIARNEINKGDDSLPYALQVLELISQR